MKAYNGEIAARACFVRIGRDPDKDPELLAEIQRAIENGVNEARKFGTPAAVYDAQQTAIAAAIEILDSLEEISTESWAGIAAGCWIDMSEIRKALAQLRAVKEE